MAKLTLTIPIDPDWSADDLLQLLIGTENAADLAASTPSGGTVEREVAVFANPAMRGGWGFGSWGGPDDDGIDGNHFTWGGVPPHAWGDASWGSGAWWQGFYPDIVIEHDYDPTDKCATLPVGVRTRDQAGNVSAAVEQVVQIEDPPIGARNLAVVTTGSKNEARLTWTESPDV